MNLETNSTKKPNVMLTSDDIDFDFKPITSGLGFHQNKTTEIKPTFHESQSLNMNSMPMPAPMARKENQIYQNELSAFYVRKDLTDIERKRYKYHLAVCNGEYSHVPLHLEEAVTNALSLTSVDMIDFKLVDIHVDFNPKEGTINERGVSKNKSYVAYKSFGPWLKSLGFRTWAKPMSCGASTAADLLLHD